MQRWLHGSSSSGSERRTAEMCILMSRVINIPLNIVKTQEWLLISINKMMIKLADEGS